MQLRTPTFLNGIFPAALVRPGAEPGCRDLGSAGASSALCLALLAATGLARAEAAPATTSLPDDPTLARLIAESVAARPELAQAQAVLEADEQRVPQASAWPDPMLQVGIQNDGFTSIQIGRMDTSFVSFMASQTVPWPGKLGLRRGVAELSASAAKQALARMRLSTEAEVRRAYLDLLLVRDRMALLGQLEALWQKSYAVARARYEAGTSAQSDVLRAQLEQTRIKQRRSALLAEERNRIQTLNRLRNHGLDEAIPTTLHIRDLPALHDRAAPFSLQAALGRSPELAAARTGITRAGRSVALAEKGYYPDLTVGAGVMVRGALPPMWLVTVGGPLPVFAGSKQNRAVDENRALERAAEQEVEALVQLLTLRSAERRSAYASLLETIELYDGGLLVQSEATAESTLSQYEVGKVAFASVLEANVGLIADQEGYLQAVAAAHRILIAEAEISLLPIAMPAGVAGSASMPGAGSVALSPSAAAASPAAGGSVAVPGGSMPSM